MEHSMNLALEPFEAIQNGSKTFELRLYDKKRQRIKENDVIIFSLKDDPEKTIKAKVLKIYIYKNFDELYRSLPLEKCGYTEDNLAEASPDDMLKYYCAEVQKKYNAVAFELEVI